MGPRKWAGLLAHGHRTLRLPMPVGTVAYAGRSHSQWRDRVGFSPTSLLSRQTNHLTAPIFLAICNCSTFTIIIHES